MKPTGMGMSLEFALERYEKGYTDLETIDALVAGIRTLKIEVARLKIQLAGAREATSLDDWEPTIRFFRD